MALLLLALPLLILAELVVHQRMRGVEAVFHLAAFLHDLREQKRDLLRNQTQASSRLVLALQEGLLFRRPRLLQAGAADRRSRVR